MITLKPHEKLALEFLEKSGPHQIGVIDSDEKLAAALGFEHMRKAGFVIALIREAGGPEYRISNRGREALVTYKEVAQFPG